jgi:hypothetical protein
MNIQEIASRLVELSRNGNFKQAQDELYAQDAVSIEAYATPAFDKETKGLNAMDEKSKRWEEMVEENHGLEVSEPLVAEKYFAVKMIMDLTMKGQGRVLFNELCVYQVNEGKITSEQFYY